MQKRQSVAQINLTESIIVKKSLEQPPSNSHMDNPPHDADTVLLQNLRRSVRKVALSSQSCKSISSQDSRSDGSSEHFLEPLSGTGFSHLGQDKKPDSQKSRQLFTPQADSSLLQTHVEDKHLDRKHLANDLGSLDGFDGVNSFLSAVDSNLSGYRSFYDIDEAQNQVFSPPLLMDAAILADSYEDLLAPLSDTETALMEH